MAKQSFREDGLILKMSAGLPGKTVRLRIVVSKKVAKQAVRRNRIRRVLKEAVKKEQGLITMGQDLVLIVLPRFELPDFRETQNMVHRLLRKASLLK